MTDTNTTATVVATPIAKAPSKKSQADAIFKAKLAERAQGLFASNKEFRAAVLVAIETELTVSRASASTMFNASKKEAEAANAEVGLGRDPKKAKPVSTGVRGRPAGSKNKAKEVAPVADTTVVVDAPEVAPVADAVA